MNSRYRSDLDGLRAIAVLAVILCHFRLLGVTGGYVGVDVFFVISGYLITGILLRDLAQGSFSLLKFYERRVRRIQPAASACLLFVLVAAIFLMSAEHFKLSAVAAIWQSFFALNLQEAFSPQGYFAASEDVKPLLHMWSLALEEQFYLLFPVTLWLVWQKQKSRLWVILFAIAVGSFILSVVGSRVKLDFSYYLLPTRAWELLSGALIAIRPTKTRRAGRELMGGIGLAMILVACFTFNERTIFPGAAAMLPAVGAMLVILAEGSVVSLVLGLSPLGFLGRISYSLYLVHWPLLVFARYYSLHPLGVGERLILVLVSIGAASVSYWYIEQPFRHSRLAQRWVFVSGLAMACPALGLGIAAAGANGWPYRFAKLGMTDELAIPVTDVTPTNEKLRLVLTRDGLCELGKVGERGPDFLIWGDSHTFALRPVIDRAASELGMGGYICARGGHVPVPGVWTPRPDSNRATFTEYNALIEQYVLKKRIPHVVLIARWTSAVGDSKNRKLLLSDTEKWAIPGKDEERSAQLLERYLTALVQRLHAKGVTVWIMLQVPEQPFDVPSKLVARRGQVRGLSRTEYETIHGKTNRILMNCGARILDPSPYLFNSEGYTILVSDDGYPLWLNHDHLNKLGGEKLYPLFKKFMTTIAESRKGEIGP